MGTDVASQLLVTAGDNPERVTSEAKFAVLVGVGPIPASSGKTTRHRHSRAGDRKANKAIHRVVLVRMRYDNRTRAFFGQMASGRQKHQGNHALPQTLRRPRNPRPTPPPVRNLAQPTAPRNSSQWLTDQTAEMLI
ncbi:transposase [Arthrobacter sp. CDRTa11]|uniref:transposase n=1 Tax=Arthrobacter sp. CDRTa11 TaxID=2651199 RepID=UPI002265AF7C|nr:transposase [Arthrobacter sp. CDRTa11]